MREVEETVSRISSNKGVKGVHILSKNGEIVLSTFSESLQIEHAKHILKIRQHASMLFLPSDNDNDNDGDGENATDPLSFIRIRSKQNEFLVAPHGDYLLAVLHNPVISNVEGSL